MNMESQIGLRTCHEIKLFDHRYFKKDLAVCFNLELSLQQIISLEIHKNGTEYINILETKWTA
jgi:hypothetical protein